MLMSSIFISIWVSPFSDEDCEKEMKGQVKANVNVIFSSDLTTTSKHKRATNNKSLLYHNDTN